MASEAPVIVTALVDAWATGPGARKRTAGTWGYENIRRLKRSLDKLSAAGQLRYSRQQWRDFVEAWHVGLCGPT